MKQTSISFCRLMACTLVLSGVACKKEPAPVPAAHPPAKNGAAVARGYISYDYELLADTLDARLKNTCTGYTFVISYMNQQKAVRSGGRARQSQDQPVMLMSPLVKYGTAGVTKTITAAALLKVLGAQPGGLNVMLDAPIHSYLPAHWTLGPGISTITFRELLNHKSGIRTPPNQGMYDCDYQSLKQTIAGGINLNSKAVSFYEDRNYGLMRLLIPKLAGYALISCQAASPQLAAQEASQANQFATFYKDYCRQAIFSQLATCAGQTIDCMNTSATPGLYYQYLSAATGILTPDKSLQAGAQGWVLSAGQLADFFRTLHYTELILPQSASGLMKNQLLGYEGQGITGDWVSYYYKRGHYNDSGAGFRDVIIGFSDGIQITLYANSMVDLYTPAIKAHEDWHP